MTGPFRQLCKMHIFYGQPGNKMSSGKKSTSELADKGKAAPAVPVPNHATGCIYTSILVWIKRALWTSPVHPILSTTVCTVEKSKAWELESFHRKSSSMMLSSIVPCVLQALMGVYNPGTKLQSRNACRVDCCAVEVCSFGTTDTGTHMGKATGGKEPSKVLL